MSSDIYREEYRGLNDAGSPTASTTSRLVTPSDRVLSKVKIPYRAPSLIDKSKPYFSGIRHFGVQRFGNLLADPFHTLLNLPWGRFVLLFFTTYMLEFLIFAVIYYAMEDHCIIQTHSSAEGSGGSLPFAHALWMSSRTASTLGFDFIRPNPECWFTNVVVMLEVISASLINFIMLGLVFARFSAPFKRASTVRFSKNAVIHRHSSGFWCLSMRVANLRKHQILQPSVRMVVTAVDANSSSNYMFEHLKIEGTAQQETNLELGFPANLVHVIRPDSLMYPLSLSEMHKRQMEVLVFLDGIDAMTSKHMSAKTAYAASELLLNEVHAPLHLEMRGRQLGLDFADYDTTISAWPELDEMFQADLIEKGESAGMWTLRHQTFKQLGEKFGDPKAADNHGAASGTNPVHKLDPCFIPVLKVTPVSALEYNHNELADFSRANGPSIVSHSEAVTAAASAGDFPNSPSDEQAAATSSLCQPLMPPSSSTQSLGAEAGSGAHESTSCRMFADPSSNIDANTHSLPSGPANLPHHLMDPSLQGPAPYATGPPKGMADSNPFSLAASGQGPAGNIIPLPTSNAPHHPSAAKMDFDVHFEDPR